MTRRSAGHTNTRDPRPWRVGKSHKRWDKTSHVIRRRIKRAIQRGDDL